MTSDLTYLIFKVPENLRHHKPVCEHGTHGQVSVFEHIAARTCTRLENTRHKATSVTKMHKLDANTFNNMPITVHLKP